MRRSFAMIASVLLGAMLAACNITNPNVTPTAEVLISETPTQAASPTPTITLTPSRTPTAGFTDVPVVVATPIPTQDGVPAPDLQVTPSPTVGPCEVTIQEGETLTQALFRVPCDNQVSNALVNAVVRFNENIVNADIVSAGTTFLVPLPTPTPIPEGADITATVAADEGVEILGNQVFVAGQEFGCYDVQEGDSLVDIADLYDTSLEVLSQRNQNLGWGGCDFTNPSGGPNCSPNLRIGQCVEVPLPTSTPVPTGTPSGAETATPTPTYAPARAITPPQGAVASAGRVTLQWVEVGVLPPDAVYLVEVADRTVESSEQFVTQQTAYTLPETLIPADGQQHTIEWRVTVARRTPDGTYQRIGGAGEWYQFLWNSR